MSGNTTNQFKVFIPIDINTTSSESTSELLHHGQQFQEIYVSPEYYIDYSTPTSDGKRLVTIKKNKPINIDLNKYTRDSLASNYCIDSGVDPITYHTNIMNTFCRTVNLFPSYCELFYCEVNGTEYSPDNGLKFWKIQRYIYRYLHKIYLTIYPTDTDDSIDNVVDNVVDDTTNDAIDNVVDNVVDDTTFVDYLAKSSLYDTDEISPGRDDEMDYMKDLNISFVSLDARTRIQEILSHVTCHNIPFKLKLRDEKGHVFVLFKE